MKFIIKRLLIAVVLISIIYESQCQYEIRKSRLSRVLENLIKKKNLHRERDDIGENIDVNCAKDFFKLPQNEKMLVNEMEEIIFKVAAALKCYDENKAFRYIFNDFVHSGMQKVLPCLKWQLQRIEPTSNLIESFEISEADIEECKKKVTLDTLEREIKGFETVLGPLKEFTCGAVTGAVDYMKFISKAAIAKYGGISEELKEAEIEKLKEYFKNITFSTINCMTKRFEDNPAAYLINDTLSYYYKKEIQPVDLKKEEDPNGYYKNLAKVEGAIDYECVKGKLNLPEFGDISLLEVEAEIIIASAKSKCIRIDPLDFADLFMDFAVEEDRRESEIFVACAKYKLQEIEPTSKLAKTSSSDEVHKSDCRHYDVSVYTYDTPLWTYKDFVGRLNETTCGVLSDEFIDVLSIKTVLLSTEKDKELRKTELEEFLPIAIGKLDKLADCILDRVK